MPTITKRSGAEEEYRTEKIEGSMRNAGISEETAAKVIKGISYHTGMATSEIRRRVIGGIKNREPQAAMRFQSHPRKTHNL